MLKNLPFNILLSVGLMSISCSSDVITPSVDMQAIEKQRDMMTDAKLQPPSDLSPHIEDSPLDLAEEIDFAPFVDAASDLEFDAMQSVDLQIELPRGYEVCDCDDPLAVCGNNKCNRVDVDCRENECPDGFVCNQVSGICMCEGSHEGRLTCKPRCNLPADCPENMPYCGPSQRCDRFAQCMDDHECPYGMFCAHGSCIAPGDKPAGEFCEVASECASGDCYISECQQRCFLDSDCPEDFSCGRINNICEPFVPPCTTTCEEDELCRGDECHPALCVATGDCERGSCYASISMHTGTCRGEETPCKDNEFKSPYITDDPYCRIFKKCDSRYPDQCPSSYTCQPTGSPRGYQENCARLP